MALSSMNYLINIKLCSVVMVILDVRSEPYDNLFSCITIHRWFQQIFGSISHVVSEDIFFKIWPEKRELPVATILTYSFLQSVILIVTEVSEEMINMYYVNRCQDIKKNKFAGWAKHSLSVSYGKTLFVKIKYQERWSV